MDTLFNTIPGFDQPIAVLKHCHDKIRKLLTTLEKLCVHLPAHGADKDAQHAAHSVLRYFDQAAPLHHADEEVDLLPLLQEIAQGEDAANLTTVLPLIIAHHIRMEHQWSVLAPQLREIQAGQSDALNIEAVQHFCELYTEHMAVEEQEIAPMALRIISPEQMLQLGAAMQERRAHKHQATPE